MNQIRFIPPEVKSGEKKLITMSAGNYGKAFGHVTKELGLKGLCLIPKFAPANRVDVIKVQLFLPLTLTFRAVAVVKSSRNPLRNITWA